MIEKLTEYFPDWMSGGGIFAYNSFAQSIFDEVLPISGQTLDLEFFGNVSGDKIASPLVQKIGNNAALTGDKIIALQSVISNINGETFRRVLNTYQIEYNPANNYDMSEQYSETGAIEYGKTRTRTDNTNRRFTASDTRAPNLTTTDSGTENETRTPNTTETRTPNTTETRTSGVFGFNSSGASNSDTSQTALSGTDTTRKTGTETVIKTVGNTRTESGTDERSTTSTETNTGTVADADTGTDETTKAHTLTRSGNIGVTTTQQMLQSERELWIWNFIREVVFPAVDKVLTIQLY